MKKTLALILAFAMMLSLCACASSPAPTGGSDTNKESDVVSNSGAASAEEKDVTIVWGDWMLSEEAYAPIYTAMYEGFDAKYEHVSVETYFDPYASYLDQLLIASAAGNGPDVAHIKAEWLPQFLALGVLKDLNPYVSDQEFMSDFTESSIAAATVDGQLVGIPWFTNSIAIFYNKALLEKAGITELPTTMPELFEAAEKISALGTDENGNKIYGLALPNSGISSGEGYNLLPILWAYGADYQDKNGKICIASEKGIEAFTAIQNLFVNDISPKGATFKDLRNLFGQGVIGFYWDSEAAISSAAKASPDADAFYANVGSMVIPSNSSANGYGYLSDRLMVVFNSCTEDKMDAIVDFVDYMSSSAAIQILQDNNQGKMSVRTSVMDEVFGNIENPITLTFIDSMATARPLPSGNLGFMEAEKMLTDAAARLAQGEDVTTVVNDAQQQIQAVYDKN